MNPEPHIESTPGLRKFRFEILLVALLLMLVYDPVIRVLAPRVDPGIVRLAFCIVFGGLMLSAVYAVSDRPRTRTLALLLGLPALIVEWTDIGSLGSSFLLGGHGLTAVFLCYVIVVLVRYVLTCDHVDANTIFASLCVYLMLGILWAIIYSLLEHVEEGSFHYVLEAEEQMRFGSDNTSASIYYSFVTMTTLGYGDIVPVSSAARALAALQAITGQLYLTVLVAWLVGLHVTRSRPNKNHPKNL